jgi:gamma-glutamyltranspeptidase
VPPDSQCLALLLQANRAQRFDLLAVSHYTMDYVHTLVAIRKLALRQRDRRTASNGDGLRTKQARAVLRGGPPSFVQ